MNGNGIGCLGAAILGQKLRQKERTLRPSRDAEQAEAAIEGLELLAHGRERNLRAFQRYVIDVGMRGPAGVQGVIVAESHEAVGREQGTAKVIPTGSATLAAVQAHDTTLGFALRPIKGLTGGSG